MHIYIYIFVCVYIHTFRDGGLSSERNQLIETTGLVFGRTSKWVKILCTRLELLLVLVRTRDRTAKKYGCDYLIDPCSLISHHVHHSTVPRFGHRSGYSPLKCVLFMLSLSLSLSCSHFLSHSHSRAHAYTLSGSLTLSLSPHLLSVS